MCGIFGLKFLKRSNLNPYYTFNKIRHRGPDNSEISRFGDQIIFGFHRLKINDLKDSGNQPFEINGNYLICNGEIYNYKELCEKYKIELQSRSDCEVILHLYLKLGIEKTLKELDGVFALAIYDKNFDTIILARDPIGVRSLYMTKNDEYLAFASEMKSIKTYGECRQFPPGFYYDFKEDRLINYFDTNYKIVETTEEEVLKKINSLFRKCVDKRMMSERPIGCILSGGLDSSLITSIVSQKFNPYTMKTYTIGLEGSVDLYWAKKISSYLCTDHKEFIVSERDFLDQIENTIVQIESYCTTTVRASVGNYLVSQKLSKISDEKVIFCGDVSDEIFGSYRGFTDAPSEEEFFEMNKKMIQDIHFFDGLRSDKTISSAGLEARVPFADKEFVNYVMSLPSRFKTFDNEKIEKNILRKAFENDNLLPKDALFRRKEAFSDGVSSKERGWFQIIKEYMDKIYTEEEFLELREKYTHNKPYDKESLYYRELFEKHYPGQEKSIPYFWRQPFSSNTDPSARLLKSY